MFQTEPILALQSLEWLSFPMWLVSQLGYTQFFILVMLAILYMVDFRKGFVLIQIVSWNGILTDLLKAFFALPRPDAVDSRVLLDGVEPNPVGIHAKGAPGFFAPLPADVVSHYRGLENVSYGFPSGHCSAATSTWGSIALLFKQPEVRAVALVMILLMPVSRMYLGRHFLAGSLGGVAQGILTVTVGWFVIIKSFSALPSLQERIRALGVRREQVIQRVYFLVLPLAAMALPSADIDDCVRLFGINLGWVLLRRKGLPMDGGPASHRLARYAVALVCFFATAMVTSRAVGALAGADSELTESATYFAATLATLWGATELGLKLGLFPGRS